jgi:hypothetical protein
VARLSQAELAREYRRGFRYLPIVLGGWVLSGLTGHPGVLDISAVLAIALAGVVETRRYLRSRREPSTADAGQ